MSQPTAKPTRRDVVIIGGSLTGLMHGIMLSRMGYRVRILEQSSGSSPESHMAGVCAASDVLWFLDKFDRLADAPLGIPSECFQSVDQHGHITVFLRAPRLMTSWDALYSRLRANFDGLKSEYCLNLPECIANRVAEGKVTAVYESGKQVTLIEVEGEKVRVNYKDSESGKSTDILADLVIGADGPNSVVRKTFLQREIPKRRYAGYIAWRGVVPEGQVSEETRKIFQRNITYYATKSGHVIVYNIPGERGSLEVGKRLLNFCWYTNQDESTLAEIMTDKNGHRHYTSVPPAKVRDTVWKAQQALANSLLIAPYKEIISKIASPFVHLITDYRSPRASMAEGKILLVGDAFTLYRPHIAFSTNQAAWNCMMVEKLVKGEMAAAVWEQEMTRFAYLHWCRSVWYGEYWQRPLWLSVFSAARYWMAAVRQLVRYWCGVGESPRI